jgi:micrococcal nuclease
MVKKPVLFILFYCLLVYSSFAQNYKVIGIIDGDTYDILVDNQSVRIRMDAIDAPERGMPFNKVAKKYLSNMIFGKFIKMVELKKDSHGRIVGKTFLKDGTDVSLEMIKAGFAWHYKKFSSDPILAKLENNARKNKLGLWQENEPLAPWEVRALHRNGVSTKERFKDSPK